MLQDKTDDVTWFIFNFFFVVVHSDDLQTSALLALALRVLCAEWGGGGLGVKEFCTGINWVQ